jgi:hypothetical protein
MSEVFYTNLCEILQFSYLIRSYFLINLSAVQNIKFSGYRSTLSQRFLHGSKEPLLWRYVTGQMKFTSNVSFWCKNVFRFDENVSWEAFSVFPMIDNDITNSDFDIQMWKWFELFTPKQVNKMKFLELFANHFTKKLLLTVGFIRLLILHKMTICWIQALTLSWYCIDAFVRS